LIFSKKRVDLLIGKGLKDKGKLFGREAWFWGVISGSYSTLLDSRNWHLQFVVFLDCQTFRIKYF